MMADYDNKINPVTSSALYTGTSNDYKLPKEPVKAGKRKKPAPVEGESFHDMLVRMMNEKKE